MEKADDVIECSMFSPTLGASSQGDGFLTYMDKNGIFDFMGGFNVARIDGTYDSELISFDPSCAYASVFVAVHF